MIDPYDHIADYINGHLSEEDRSTFEALLAKDSDLKLAVDNHSVAMDVVGSLIEDEVRGVLGELETEDRSLSSSLDAPNSGKKYGKIRWINVIRNVAAASVIGLVGFWGVNQYQYNQLENEIYANHYKKLLNGGVRGGIESNINRLDSVITYFDLNENTLSLNLINKQANTTLDSTLFRYKIHNLYLLAKHTELIQLANSFPNKMTNELKEILIYSLLLTNQKEEAKIVFDSLSLNQRSKLESLFL